MEGGASLLKAKKWTNKLVGKGAGAAEGKAAKAGEDHTFGGVLPGNTFDEEAKNARKSVRPTQEQKFVPFKGGRVGRVGKSLLKLRGLWKEVTDGPRGVLEAGKGEDIAYGGGY